MEAIKHKGNPGTGAIELAREFTEGLTKQEALLVINKLLRGELLGDADKRIKRCDNCGYPYRDKTRPNNSKTCSRQCKFTKDNQAKTVKVECNLAKSADEALKSGNSNDKTFYKYYASHLEYPYYMNENYMLNYARQREIPRDHGRLEQIEAAKIRGYKRQKTTPTDGSDTVHVRGLRYKGESGEVEIKHMTTREIDDYLKSKYSEDHLSLERKRAISFEQFSRSKKHYK